MIRPSPQGGLLFVMALSQCVEICTAAVLFLFIDGKEKDKVAIVAKKAKYCMHHATPPFGGAFFGFAVFAAEKGGKTDFG